MHAPIQIMYVGFYPYEQEILPPIATALSYSHLCALNMLLNLFSLEPRHGGCHSDHLVPIPLATSFVDMSKFGLILSFEIGSSS